MSYSKEILAFAPSSFSRIFGFYLADPSHTKTTDFAATFLGHGIAHAKIILRLGQLLMVPFTKQ